MQVMEYDKRYISKLGELLKSHNLPGSLINDLPFTGVVAMDGDTLVAAGFIRLCEGRHGMIDSLISNPKVSPGQRDKALDLVNTRLIEEAKRMKLVQLVAFTGDANTIMRAERLGFIVTNHKVIGLKLSTKAE